MTMKMIFKTAKELGEILGIDERSVTYRVVAVRRKVYMLDKKTMSGEMKFIEAEKIIDDLLDKKLGGFNYSVKGTDARPQYTFYKYE